MKRQSLKEILQRAKTKLGVNRREFLKALGPATVAVVGMASIISHIHPNTTFAESKTIDQNAGQNAKISRYLELASVHPS